MVFGGIDMKPQTLELKAGVEVLIATPGRLLDHIEAKNAVLNQVEYVARRGRPHARHRLPARPAAHPQLPAQGSARRCCSRPPSPTRSRLAESYLQDPVLVEVARPERHRLDGGAALLQRRRRRQAPRRASLLKDRSSRRRWCSSTQARLRAPGALVRARRPEAPPRCTATRARTSG